MSESKYENSERPPYQAWITITTLPEEMFTRAIDIA